MQKRWLWIVPGLACVIVIAALWPMWTRTVQEAAPLAVTPAPVVPAPAAEPAPAVTVAVPLAAPMESAPPDLWLPSHDLRDYLGAANAGDTVAMLRVGQALRACVEHIADPDASKLREEQEREMDALRARHAPDDADATGVFAHWNERFALRFATHADCIAIGAERIGTGLQWIERAARAGDPEAKLAYARDAFSEFPDGNSLLANLDEVARRRDLARAWAMQALEAGELGAVDVLARAYSGESGLFPRNYQQAAPYWMAQEMLSARSMAPDEFRQLYDQGPERERYGWGNENAWVHDDVAWQAALERAREIVNLIPPEPYVRRTAPGG